jgi:hypothetical protein
VIDLPAKLCIVGQYYCSMMSSSTKFKFRINLRPDLQYILVRATPGNWYIHSREKDMSVWLPAGVDDWVMHYPNCGSNPWVSSRSYAHHALWAVQA